LKTKRVRAKTLVNCADMDMVFEQIININHKLDAVCLKLDKHIKDENKNDKAERKIHQR